MTELSYRQFCPVAKACEVLEPRWTLLILCEMWSGSTHFNEIKRGVPSMSPTLLSKRLKEMEAHGLLRHAIDVNDKQKRKAYTLTSKAMELEPVVHMLGEWAYRHVDTEISLQDLDAGVLMWNMRRKINIDAMPAVNAVVHFRFAELQGIAQQDYWLVKQSGQDVDLCINDPGYDVDLFVDADLRALTSVWMGYSCLQQAIRAGEIRFSGDTLLAESMDHWMVRSSFAEM